MMSIEAPAGFLDEEIERAIERLRQSRREIKADTAALDKELARHRQRPQQQDFTAYHRDEEFDTHP